MIPVKSFGRNFLLKNVNEIVIFIILIKIIEMGCNCKKKAEMIEAKYGDGKSGISAKLNPIMKVIQFFAQMAFGIVFGAIIIVMVIPMLIYIILCMMFGREPKINVSAAGRYLSRK